MTPSEFTHPDDAAALKTLESIPVLHAVVKKVMDIGIEQMTHGSIKVLADNLANGTFHDANKKEAAFLYRLIDYKKETALYSKSGTFFIDKEGIVQRFEPAADNLLIEEETEIKLMYTYTTHRSIRTFIVPKGVTGFVSGFMRGTRVIDCFELPEGLLSIGNNLFDQDGECNCVFANCILPSVIVPESVKEIGLYAFGHSHIDNIQLPKSLHSPYGRQFKDSFIGALILPKEWEGKVSIEGKGGLRLNGDMFYDEKYGYLRWPSTRVLNLEFY